MAEEKTKAAETVEKADAKAEKKPAPKKDKVKFTDKVKKFWRDYKSEFKKIVWPSKEETTKSTMIVIVSIVVCAIVIGILDFAFSKGITLLGHL